MNRQYLSRLFQIMFVMSFGMIFSIIVALISFLAAVKATEYSIKFFSYLRDRKRYKKEFASLISELEGM